MPESQQLQVLIADAVAEVLIAESPSMRRVVDAVARAGPSDSPILVTGERGSGKGAVARALHAASPRAAHLLVTVDASHLSEALFETAGDGTLLLDEISRLAPAQQAELLGVIDADAWSARLISTASVDLASEIAAGRFREDLLSRLCALEIRVPALRERREDIPLLAAHFLGLHGRRHRKPLIGFEPAALRVLVEHAWPGNVRELDRAVERGVLAAEGAAVRLADLGLKAGRDGSARLEEMSLGEAEASLVRRAMARHGNNVSRAARALGVSRSALYRRLQRIGS
jgi:DNA-binding NtrC family response regulator